MKGGSEMNIKEAIEVLKKWGSIIGGYGGLGDYCERGKIYCSWSQFDNEF